MKKGQKFIAIVIGPPGAGKGTQAELLADKLGLYSFETSRVLEESWAQANKDSYIKVNEEKIFLLEEKKLFNSGALCSPPFVTIVVKKKIKELANQGRGIVFSGSPRTLYEGKELIPLMIELYGKENIVVLNLKVSDKEAIWRNTRRRICSKCRYPLPFTEENRKLKNCPKCGGKLVTRTLDTAETMKIRLKEYKKRTFPLFDYFKKTGITVKEINGEQSIENVHKDVLEFIKHQS